MNRQSVIRLFSGFLILYALLLPAWLQVKSLYQPVVNVTAFRAAWCYDLRILNARVLQDGTTQLRAANRYVLLKVSGDDEPIVFDVILDSDAVMFNVPMTLALLLSIVLMRHRNNRGVNVVSGMLALTLLHLITMLIVSFSTIIGVAVASKALAHYLQHAWMPEELLFNLGSLLSHYAARFEPFLIAVFVWSRSQSEIKPEFGKYSPPETMVIRPS